MPRCANVYVPPPAVTIREEEKRVCVKEEAPQGQILAMPSVPQFLLVLALWHLAPKPGCSCPKPAGLTDDLAYAAAKTM